MNLLKNKKKFSGGALILQMFLAVCFMVWLFPVNAYAAETTVDWSTIRSAVDGACQNTAQDTSGDGWSYSHDTDTVTIAEGTKVTGDVDKFICLSGLGNIENIHSNGGIFNGTIASGNFTGTVINEGTINAGTFNGEVTNNNTITNGMFNGTVTNGFGRYIHGGTFTNAVTNYGSIYGGTFTNAVTNDSYIHDGTFEGTVTNMSFIVGGTFTGAVTSENSSQITDGTFTDTVTNEGIISGGTFNETVTNEGIISKGRFNIIVNKVNGIVGGEPDVIYNQLINEGNGSNPNPNPGDDEGNTPSQNPGNNGNNTSNSKDNNKYVFVEPVVIVVPEGQKYVEDVLAQLEKVSKDRKVVIDTKDWYCFNRTLAEKVTSMKDITVTIKYKYQGKRYEVTIPAGSDIVSLLGETGFVGFRYLDLVFGGREITE